MQGKRIVLGVTGSIAAYKAADLCSGLVREGAQVHVVMTEAATKLIAPLTLQTLSRNPVHTDMWTAAEKWNPNHIDLADSADLLLVAPATANTLANFANGQAPDLLSNIYLATPAPLLFAPAMNGKMYQHPATQRNIQQLIQWGGVEIPPSKGMLACGYEGVGKLAPVDEILAKVKRFFTEEMV